MKFLSLLLSALLTIGAVTFLNIPLTMNGAKTPRLGYFLSPQKGFWQNAEPAEKTFDMALKSDLLKGKTTVYIDQRLVPHIYADNESDAYFAEGYLHAKFRLWQMDFQTDAAAGRLSEIMGAERNGTNFLAIDKYFRRLGMVYAAQNSLAAMEANPLTKAACDAYTAGVNAYIQTLTEASYPLEYKLLDYRPEPWTNLKTALFLKYMSFDLAGGDNDFEMTNAKSFFTRSQFEKLFPYGQDSAENIIPKGTVFAKPGVDLKIPGDVDSIYFNFKDTIKVVPPPVVPDKNNGSNNWAVSGTRTLSGRPILCNDPHLGLNLPSLWFEVQITTPGYNAYGVSFPGSPAIIIGFNDSCAFGVTNAGRDVKDYYEIRFRDSTHRQYWFNGQWLATGFRDEIIKIKNQPSDTEHLAMTVWGPVIYDQSYPDKLHTGRSYAVRWTAHDSSNELQTFMLLDRSRNFQDYTRAIAGFECPGQNFVFAAKNGDIAIKEQGAFPAKWRRQGDFLMPGYDSSYAWKYIPDSENLILKNPARGFVSSANQYPYDTTYPYYMGGTDYEYFRGKVINRNLSAMHQITTDDMEKLQLNNDNLTAEMARPWLLKYLRQDSLDSQGKKYLAIFKHWNLRNNPEEEGPVVFDQFWDSLYVCMYADELSQSPYPLPEVTSSTLLEALKDSAYEFADNINTPQKETMADVITQAFRKIIPVLENAEKEKRLTWGKFKDSEIDHLLKIPAFSRKHLDVGGGADIVDAIKKNHGPSWRMVVELTDKTHAYGVYPGGQSGNPGSRYYDNFIDTWKTGKYYPLSLLKKAEIKNNPDLRGIMTFEKS